MRLSKVRVQNFKSVLDSGWFSVDELTCLVGKNESGKTAILEAIEKLNSVLPGRTEVRETEYPRMNWSEYEESDQADVAIRTQWELDSEEIEYITDLAGDKAVLDGTTITLTKDYDNELHWTLPLDLKKAAEVALANSGLESDEKAALKGAATTFALMKALRDNDERSPRQEAFLSELDERWHKNGLWPTVIIYLRNRLPGFVYYSQYDRLPGRVSLNQLLEHQAAGSIDQLQGARVFLALLSMVGTTPEGIKGISTSEQLISKLEAVGARLSKKIFKYWSQNKHLKVNFRFDEAAVGDPAPFNSGKVFQTRIENLRHGATIRLDERSTGFIWFFSFLVWFSEVQKTHGDNLIVLLDEPGLTLHAKAQADLLRYMKAELLPRHQVLYTTHSPFMIDPTDLLSCRTVEDVTAEDDEVLGTKVGDRVLSADNDTLFPLQAALGYDVTQTLFVGKNCLLVEGPSDLLYIRWASDRLRERDRIALDNRWTVTPCGGITKIPSFMALFGGNELNVVVLTDYGQGDKKKVRELRESELLKDGRVFSADMYCEGATEADTEDLLGRSFYVALVNKAYGLTAAQVLPEQKPEDSPQRATAEVEEHFRVLPSSVAEYDHYAPARYLLEHSGELMLPGVEEALDRFEKLFADLNKLL
ncbi:ATP-dependent nuclease [Amycolatopsis pithecellobii]|uniref:AAA family ATPase n=1 Tax=Amycolatopsis pithecellobii TaxID=664692 RepID=A0A6N7Z898_9PSEU|nr:AAA family ATPase [Amycolatopsis pithecellobii]MTD57821.1 AAA family ATPase [Amycolatopsis pithecellobii]